MTPEEYLGELERHDWFYSYTDDHRVWRLGRDNLARLKSIAQENPKLLALYNAYSEYMFGYGNKPTLTEDV